MILAATILCQRKLSDWKTVLPSLFNLDYPDLHIYVNVQYREGEKELWNEMQEWLSKQTKPYSLDMWSYESSWNKEATIQDEQDNSKRLVPICIARNMTLQYAKSSFASHIFFVDADVAVPSNSISVLVNHNKSIIGGIVPSRGSNKNILYVFGANNYPQPLKSKNLYEVDHTTCGFILIKRDVFRKILFSYDMELGASEDPLFGMQAREQGFSWWVDKNLVASHHSNNQ